MKGSTSLLLAAMLSLPMLANAAEPQQCSTVNFSDVGWTDITVTTATTSVVLDALGYKTKTTMISVPVTYKSLADGKNMDVFLGNWMPTMEKRHQGLPRSRHRGNRAHQPQGRQVHPRRASGFV
nr:hypothetical protein GCM10020185_39710 [Pseudomonas brassicacearum subsp. brassicacearum]